MIPIKFKEHNKVMGEEQEEYLDLPAHLTVDGECTMCMHLDAQEIAELIESGCLWITTFTFNRPLQPIRMSTLKPEDFEKPEPKRLTVVMGKQGSGKSMLTSELTDGRTVSNHLGDCPGKELFYGGTKVRIVEELGSTKEVEKFFKFMDKMPLHVTPQYHKQKLASLPNDLFIECLPNKFNFDKFEVFGYQVTIYDTNLDQ
jgi:hypothetical protein